MPLFVEFIRDYKECLIRLYISFVDEENFFIVLILYTSSLEINWSSLFFPFFFLISTIVIYQDIKLVKFNYETVIWIY